VLSGFPFGDECLQVQFLLRAVDDRPIVESVLPEIKFHMPEEVDVQVAEKVAFEQDRMTVEDLNEKGCSLVKEGEKACKEICGEMEVPGSSVMERADEFIEQIEENSRKIIENDIKLAELKRGVGGRGRLEGAANLFKCQIHYIEVSEKPSEFLCQAVVRRSLQIHGFV